MINVLNLCTATTLNTRLHTNLWGPSPPWMQSFPAADGFQGRHVVGQNSKKICFIFSPPIGVPWYFYSLQNYSGIRAEQKGKSWHGSRRQETYSIKETLSKGFFFVVMNVEAIEVLAHIFLFILKKISGGMTRRKMK